MFSTAALKFRSHPEIIQRDLGCATIKNAFGEIREELCLSRRTSAWNAESLGIQSFTALVKRTRQKVISRTFLCMRCRNHYQYEFTILIMNDSVVCLIQYVSDSYIQFWIEKDCFAINS